eukprot:6472540-Ditylum_brightwellii.AAC.1
MEVQSILLDIYTNTFDKNYQMLPKNPKSIIKHLQKNGYTATNQEVEAILKRICSPKNIGNSNMKNMEGVHLKAVGAPVSGEILCHLVLVNLIFK